MVRTAPLTGPRRVVRPALAAGALWLLPALAACEPAPEVVTLPLLLRQLAACPVGEPAEIELVALGDFPSRSFRLPGDASAMVDDLPVDVRELAVRTHSEKAAASGRRVRGSEAGEQALWVLPSDVSCPLSDVIYLRVSAGAAVAALPQGGALLVGGSESETLASAAAFLLIEGQETGVAVEGGMLLRRSYASATVVGDVVVVAGGSADLRARAHDTYELFDVPLARFDPGRSGKLQRSRMQHAAVRLPDQRVLLVGGRAEFAAEPLATAELLDVQSASSELLEGPAGLQVARAQPQALVLDSGRVLVLAGRDASGRIAASVEVFEPEQKRFVSRLSELPVHEEVVSAALPGARVAWLGCDHAPEGAGAQCALTLIFEDDGQLSATDVSLPFAQLAPNGLTALRLRYMGGGTLLLTAADDSDPTARRRAFLIDPVAGTLRRVDASRVPAALLRLDSGVIVELDAVGASLRASDSHSRYASPQGDLLADAATYLTFDAPGHWLWQATAVQALYAGARVDVDELRWAGLRARISVQGDYEALLYDGGGQALSLQVRAGELQVDGCRARLPDAQELDLLRVGETLTIAGTACAPRAPSAPLGIGLRLQEGALLTHLLIDRL